MTDLSEQVLAKNTDDHIVEATEFYWWLENGNWINFRHINILYYLEDKHNYMTGRDKVDEHTVNNLKIIYDYFTDEHKELL